MKSIRWTLVTAALMALPVASLEGCASFEYPPAGPPADASPYLGEWVSEDGAWRNERLTVSAGAGGAVDVVLTNLDANESVSTTVKLVDVGGKTIAAIEGDSGGWDLSEVAVVSDTLQGRSIDVDLIRRDIISGVIAGEIVRQPYEPYEDVVRVTASDAEVRTYILGKPEVFPTENTGMMVRPTAPPAASAAMAAPQTEESGVGSGLRPLGLLLSIVAVGGLALALKMVWPD